MCHERDTFEVGQRSYDVKERSNSQPLNLLVFNSKGLHRNFIKFSQCSVDNLSWNCIFEIGERSFGVKEKANSEIRQWFKLVGLQWGFYSNLSTFGLSI